MGVRADLVQVANALAAESLRALDPQPTGIMGSGPVQIHYAGSPEKCAALATAAKAAFEAAAMAENISPDAIEVAFSHIQDLLEDAGVLAEWRELDTVDFLARTYGALLAWRKEAMDAQAHVVAYEQLEQLALGLERDFLAGGTPTSNRLAMRIRSVLDENEQMIKHAKGADVAATQA